MTSTELAADPAGVSREELDRLVGGVHHDPHSLLGLHPVRLSEPEPPGPVASATSGPDAIDQAAAAAASVPPLPGGAVPPANGTNGTTTATGTAPGTGAVELDSGADPQPPVPGRLVVRTLRPDARAVTAVFGDRRHELEQVHPAGVFAAVVPGPVSDYRLEVAYPTEGGGAETLTVDDAYRWLPTLGEIDLHLISEGRHERLWDALGAHVRTYDTPHGPVSGTSFAVWAPNARGVRVTGDFDYWQSRAYPMRSLGSSGVWEIFVPGVVPGAKYKFSILGQDGQWRDKADPMAF
ncbi:MAG TPA: hypothetical protein VLM05_20150, partial [Mycobacteriales bacterium]|nr:hypothetical protein [Mycobacteriales bacterium]